MRLENCPPVLVQDISSMRKRAPYTEEPKTPADKNLALQISLLSIRINLSSHTEREIIFAQDFRLRQGFASIHCTLKFANRSLHGIFHQSWQRCVPSVEIIFK